MKKYTVKLTAAQREELMHMISTGKAAARELTHARILLKADQGPDGPGWSDAQIQDALDISASTVARVRKRCAERGVQEAILPAKASAIRQRRLDGSQEAHLIALACSQPPDGCVRWTLRLLASQQVELGYVETVSHETVRKTLLANELKPWIKKQWCISTQPDAEFVYHMEDVLSVYTCPYDPRYPQICMDEINTQLLAETREPLPMEPGKPKREDYEYERQRGCVMSFWPASRWLVNATRWSQRSGPNRNGLSFFAACPTSTIPRQRKSFWSWITSIRTPSRPSMRSSQWPRHVGCVSALRCITPPSMQVGSTWPRLNSRRWIGNVCCNSWPLWRSLCCRSRPGLPGAIRPRLPSIGVSPLRMRPSNSNISTRQPVSPRLTEH